jgi:hypothetical protein
MSSFIITCVRFATSPSHFHLHGKYFSHTCICGLITCVSHSNTISPPNVVTQLPKLNKDLLTISTPRVLILVVVHLIIIIAVIILCGVVGVIKELLLLEVLGRTPIRRVIVVGALVARGLALLELVLVSGGVVVGKFEEVVRHRGRWKKGVKKEEGWYQRVGGVKNM